MYNSQEELEHNEEKGLVLVWAEKINVNEYLIRSIILIKLLKISRIWVARIILFQ